MLFAPALADRAILPTAWGGRYFFNRIGRIQPFPPQAIASPIPGRHIYYCHPQNHNLPHC
ncbi:hypothetical protein IPC875_32085 [Pseudomonas aeruginosa]|nr:hypothetical protein IPC875_32085 [Pseudomonas aeruginosa]